jgi:crotonobetainyl-CoA:carnitine CoA-transferase CaiB-like acyl-CoA transferase
MTPIVFSDTKLDLKRGVPLLGEHNDEILNEL